MRQIRDHRDLIVWQKSMALVVNVYHLSKRFPRNERFNLTQQQLHRAVVSIPSNIAEGHGRGSTGAYQNHLSIALGSLAEVDTQLELAYRLNYIDKERSDEIKNSLEEVGKMLRALNRSLNRVPRS